MKDTEYPKYTYKEPGENPNVSRRSPLREFLTLLGGLLGAIVMIYVLLGLAVDWAAPRLPGDVEASLGRLFLSLLSLTITPALHYLLIETKSPPLKEQRWQN